MNNNQLDALFIFSLLSYHTCKCFGRIRIPRDFQQFGFWKQWGCLLRLLADSEPFVCDTVGMPWAEFEDLFCYEVYGNDKDVETRTGKDRDGIRRYEGDICLEVYGWKTSILPYIKFTMASFLLTNFITAFGRKKSICVLMWTWYGSRN
jgi:hypothetical protein